MNIKCSFDNGIKTKSLSSRTMPTEVVYQNYDFTLKGKSVFSPYLSLSFIILLLIESDQIVIWNLWN